MVERVSKKEMFDALLSFRIDASGYIDHRRFPEAGEVVDDYFKVLVYMLGLESELADFINKPREGVERTMRSAYEKYRAEEAAFERKARAAGISLSEGAGHHSKNLKTSAIVGVATGGVVYGVAKWKESWVKRNLHLAPEHVGIIAGVAGLGASYYLI